VTSISLPESISLQTIRLPPQPSRVSAHAISTPSVRCALALQGTSGHPLSIIANPTRSWSFVIADFHFDLSGLCVPERIPHRLGCNPVDFISKDRI